MHRIAFLLAAALAAIVPLQPSCACEGSDPGPCPGLADVQVLDRSTGRILPLHRHEGETWVAGVPGHSYAVRIRNATPARILGVLAVDGVNAVSGESAGWNQTGYVLSPWESYDVLGWRKSRERVADFVFTSLEDSYAARTGRAQDVGVIGIAIFREKVRPPRPSVDLSSKSPGTMERTLRDAAPAADSADGAPAGSAQNSIARSAVPAPRLGTGHGESESSWVGTTGFERAQARPDLVVSIRYDRPEALVAMGILPGAPWPRAFPESADAGFVPDPPGWR